MKNLLTIKGNKKILTYCTIKNKLINTIIIHESGIYLIEHKNNTGTIIGEENDKFWIKKKKGLFGIKKKKKIPNPITEIQEIVKWIKDKIQFELPVYAYITYNEECNINKLEFKPFKQPVRIAKHSNVTNYIKNKAYNQEKIISQDQIDRIYEELYYLTEKTINL